MNWIDPIALLGVVIFGVAIDLRQRKQIESEKKARAEMEERVSAMERSVGSLPNTEQRIMAEMSSRHDALGLRLDATDGKLKEVRDLLASVANKIGAIP